MYGTPRSRRGVARQRRVALGVSTALIATLLQAVAFTSAAEAAGTGHAPVTDPDRPVARGEAFKTKPRTVSEGPRTPREEPKAAWPEAGSAVVTLRDPAAGTGASVRAKGLPLELNTPAKRVESATGGSVEARVLSREAARKTGIDGLLITLEARDADSAGAVGATVDYSSFAQAFGGGYASRLTLVELPACALTSPAKPACRTTAPVATDNDTEAQTLTATAVPVRSGGPTVLAAVAGDEGKTGDYKATPLSATSTWSTSLNTGDFSWSYGIPVPTVPGDMVPKVGMAYSSGTVDGRTGSSNNQSSWVGDGFDLWPGYIERRYKPCADDGEKAADGVNKPADLCWGYDNAHISFNGKGSELVPVGSDEFRLQQDDGTRIARLKATARNNGDNDNEYWRVTDPAGNRYYFGYHRLEGWTDGKKTTDSTWTVPVYGNNDGEPCHSSTFADSWCQQAWRWNLDYAIDTHGNAIAYYYNKETNSYGRNLKAADDTPYTRGGYLDHIEYGIQWDQVYSAKPLAKVNFTSAERCLPDSRTDCSSIAKDAFYWYDTPWDMNCEAATDCDKGRLSPTFWTRKRLTGITTEVLNGTTYSTVDSYKLTHRWGQADIDYQLLLDSLQHTGHTTATPVTLPPTTFAYTQLENRLDRIGDGYAPFVKARLSSVSDEQGGEVDVTYSAPACDAAALPTPQTNTTRCFPQMLGGSDTEDPERHWFNKYVVTSTTATDRTGGAPDAVTAYDYLDGGAWHYDDDDGLTKEKNKTWSQWRGYGHVRVKTGGAGGGTALKTQKDSYFLRGMDGDRKDTSGGTKSVSVTLGDGEGDAITDHESASGFAYRTEAYSGPGGKVLEKTVDRPWHHETGKRVRSWGTITSNFTGTAHTQTFTSLDAGAGAKWRTSSKTMTHDTVAGRLTQTADHGETAVADNTCTRTAYATNTGANILVLPSRTETVAVDCSATPDRTGDVLSDVRTAYDGGAYDAAPTKGDATTTAVISKHNGTTATYLESGTTYDAYGRPLTVTDLTADVTATESTAPVRKTRTDGLTSTTAYSPATGFPTTIVAKTPPAQAGQSTTAQTTTTTLDPLRGQPVSVQDTNSKATNFAYDALGRSDKVWLADRKTGQTPTYDFDYFVEDGKPTAIRTLTLNNGGGQIPSYTLYDGMLRPRQTQDVGPDGGSLIADTFYDERGQVARNFSTYYTVAAPSKVLFPPADALSVETQTWHAYDGLGRETETRQVAGNGDGGTVLGITQTLYGGDRTTVVPPVGGTATTTLTDVRGQVTELRQHHARSATAAYDTTSYSRSLDGQLTGVTDPAGNKWSYEYDLLGRLITTVDPDKGTTRTQHDDRGRVLTTTDAEATVLHHSYDQLGRPTELREKNATGTLRAAWTYDTITGAKGRPVSSTRYADGVAYTTKVTQYDQLYRPVRTAVTIPDTTENKGLAGTYQTGTSYGISGLVAGVSYSAAGSLPGGSFAYTYDDTLRPVSLLGDRYQADTSYSLTGKPLQYSYFSTAAGAKKAMVKNAYEWGTQRLASSRVEREDVAGVDRSTAYTYDQAGNVLSVADVSRAGTDNQCFTYDYLRRLTEAWTEADTTCQSAASADAVGGVAPYWHSYGYDLTGNRKTETLHDLTGATGKDIQRSYSYPPAGTSQPHTLDEITETGPTGPVTTGFDYDRTGNTVARPNAGGNQTLAWDAEGHLAKVTQSVTGKADEVTSYVYDAGGSRLITRGPDRTTLTVGNTELVVLKGATTAKATRYIGLGGGSQAVQADDGSVSITIADHLGTGQLAVTVTGLQLTQRRTLPFGGNRGGTVGVWPGTKGYVGGTDDTATTGLTHLGAREYDPATGRFISVDPVMDLTDPQQINGYTYANNTPVTSSDPSGLWLDDGTGHSEPHPKAGGKPRSDVGVPRGGTGSGGCYHSCAPSGQTLFTCGCATGPVGSPGINVSDKEDAVAYLTVLEQTPVVHPALTEISIALCGWVPVAGLACDGYDVWRSWDEGDITGVVVGAIGFLPFGDIAKSVKQLDRVAEAIKRSEKAVTACKCFLAGTDVLMADGTTKDIEDVELGDEVRATDPETGETGPRSVTRLIRTNGDKYFNELSIATDEGIEKVTATHEHPFWSPSARDWVAAGALEPGMSLRTATGETVTVTDNRAFTKRATTYNLTVDELHTYYVLAGQTPVLVHNSNCDVSDLASKIDVENISMTKTVENHTWDIAGTRDVDAPNFGKAARPYMNGNNGMLLREIMGGSVPRMDSRGAPGVVEWRTPGGMNGSNGIWELNIDANSNRIVHFLFKSTKG